MAFSISFLTYYFAKHDVCRRIHISNENLRRFHFRNKSYCKRAKHQMSALHVYKGFIQLKNIILLATMLIHIPDLRTISKHLVTMATSKRR